jgi:hypothetical protein
MQIIIGTPVLQSVGSADDGDAAGPPASYGPVNRIGQCNDGPSASNSVPASALVLSVTAQAVSGNNATANATANAKASSKASLTITYSWVERFLALFGRKQRLAASVDFACLADINNGPNRATFAVFITGGPGGVAPIPVYQVTYDFIPVPGQQILDVNKNSRRAFGILNPDQLVDADPGLTVPIDPGTYTLQFEVNAQCTADGRVVLSPVGILKLAEV